jgi:hypothetical protein
MVLYILPSELFIVFPVFPGFFIHLKIAKLVLISPEEEKSENSSAENGIS